MESYYFFISGCKYNVNNAMNFTMLKRIIYFLIYFDLWTIFAERISQERHDIMIYMYVGKFMTHDILQSQNLSFSNFVLTNFALNLVQNVITQNIITECWPQMQWRFWCCRGGMGCLCLVTYTGVLPGKTAQTPDTVRLRGENGLHDWSQNPHQVITLTEFPPPPIDIW